MSPTADDSFRRQHRDYLPGASDERPPQPRLPLLRDPPRGASLSPLAAPNLDDRSSRTSSTRAKRLIPRYCPEWTNHNLSDPGVALIELFAWMSEMILLPAQPGARPPLHQVPRAGRASSPSRPRRPRRTLTFWLSTVLDHPVTVGRDRGRDRAWSSTGRKVVFDDDRATS